MQTSTRSNPVSRPSQSRPSDAIIHTILLLLLLKGNQTLLENTGCKSALSHLALSHSRFPTALRQPPPHPASKKSRTFIEVSDCSPHRRLCVFVGAA